jgi:hypothetical protein
MVEELHGEQARITVEESSSKRLVITYGLFVSKLI